MIRWDLKPIANILGYEIDFNENIFNITTDSRQVKKGSLFVAIKGENFDGHDYIKEAFSKEAAAAVTERKVPGLMEDNYCFYVEDSKDALLKIASGYKDFTKIKTVGVTGSVGKTTTKDMIFVAVDESVKAMKTKDNLNNELGVAYTLLEIEKEDRVGVIELGMDRKGDIDYLSTHLRPDVSIITALGKSHLEFLKTIDEVAKEKLAILKGMKKDSPIILNFDNEYLLSKSGEIKNPVISYGTKDEGVDFFGYNITYDYKNLTTTYSLKREEKTYKIVLPTIGLHNVVNSLGALAVCESLGLDIKKSITGLLNYSPSGMRQKIVKKYGITFIEDCYNASPESMEAALITLGNMTTEGRKIAVLGDMCELGRRENQEHERLFTLYKKNKIDYLFLTGELTKNTFAMAKEAGDEAVRYFENKNDLGNFLANFIKKDDIALFKSSRALALEDVVNIIYKEKSGVE